MISYPADKVSVLIANVYNGPGSKREKDWASIIANATSHGKTVIGYVRTGYLGLDKNGKFGPKPFETQLGSSKLVDWVAQIQSDVETWYRYVNCWPGWYDLLKLDRLYPGVMGGIFFDETWPECDVNNRTSQVYRLLSDNTKRKHPGAFTVLNSGESIPQCFEERLGLCL